MVHSGVLKIQVHAKSQKYQVSIHTSNHLLLLVNILHLQKHKKHIAYQQLSSNIPGFSLFNANKLLIYNI